MSKAPYNFVPFGNRIVAPAWEASIDIPFDDGLSGILEYQITADSPIFIRDGQKGSEEAGEKTTDFSSFCSQKFIPATSMKGCIRNVLKIISFGYFEDHSGTSNDLAETMLGSIVGTKAKGRIQFSPCFSQNPTIFQTIILNLFSPHPETTYLYNNDNGEKKGWKRYVLKDFKSDPKDTRKSDPKDTRPVLQPLGVGTTFFGSIRFHNLCPVELGALLSALTFFGQEDRSVNEQRFFHQIGQGKPYGLGRISVSLKKMVLLNEESEPEENIRWRTEAQKYIDLFIEYMEQQIDNYKESPTITEFLTLCSFIAKTTDDRFDYMKDEDKDHTRLKYLSEIIHKKAMFPQLDSVMETQKEKEEEENRLRKEREEKERQEREARIAEQKRIDALLAKLQEGHQLVQERKFAEAKTVYDETRCDDNLKDRQEIVSAWRNMIIDLDIISNELKEKESFSSYIQRQTNINTLVKQVEKKYMPLNESDTELLKENVYRILASMKAKDQKAYKNRKAWDILKPICSDERIEKWFNEYNQ